MASSDAPGAPGNRVSALRDYDTLVRLAGFFHISIDRLLRQDLRSLSQFHLGQLLRGHDKLTYIDRKLDPVK